MEGVEINKKQGITVAVCKEEVNPEAGNSEILQEAGSLTTPASEEELMDDGVPNWFEL